MRGFLKAIFQQRELLISLVKNDFKQKYLNNFLGILWAFIQPTVTILILWFVFQMGFRAGRIEVGALQVPFVIWLVSGIIPWFYFAESLTSTCSAVKDNSFLVKKIVFRVSLLPLVKQASALIVHIFFVAVLLMIFMFYGYKPSIYWLQIPYYMFAATILLIGIAWMTSSVVVFFNDLSQIVAMITQFGFWLTPIFWQLSMIPERFQWIFKLNPAYYIIDGFRASLITHQWFWERPRGFIIFWLTTMIFVYFGSMVFRKLRPHFADVL